MSTIEAEIGNRLIDLNANRYLTAAGVFVLAYDSILTFPDEICYVWIPLIRDMSSRLRKGQNLETSRALSFSSFAHKSVLIVLRYVTLTVSSLFLYSLMPSSAVTENWCRRVLPISMGFDIVFEITGSSTVLYRLYSLWDLDSRSARISLCGLAAITLFCAIVGISAIAKTQKHIILQHLGDIRSCSANDTAPLAIVAIGSILALDIVAFSLLLLNALSRPRTESQHLLRVLYQDGMIFFLATVAMRLMNVIIMANSISQIGLFYMGIIFSGTLVITSSCRLLLSFSRREADEELFVEPNAEKVTGKRFAPCNSGWSYTSHDTDHNSLQSRWFDE